MTKTNKCEWIAGWGKWWEKLFRDFKKTPCLSFTVVDNVDYLFLYFWVLGLVQLSFAVIINLKNRIDLNNWKMIKPTFSLFEYRYLLMSILFIKGAVKWSMSNKNTCKRDCIPLERKWEESFRYLVIKIHYLDRLSLHLRTTCGWRSPVNDKVCLLEKESHTSSLKYHWN